MPSTLAFNASTLHTPFRNTPRPLEEDVRRAGGTFNEWFFEEPEYEYSTWHLEQAELFTRCMRTTLTLSKDMILLDVGCALGGVVQTLRTQGHEAYGVDISPYCLERSPMKQYLHFGSACSLPCADESIDILLSFDTFQYLSPADVRKAAREFRRVTRHAVCFEAIDRDSPFASQVTNEDRARRTDDLCTAEEYRIAFLDAGFCLAKSPFLPKEEDGFSFAYNAIFTVAPVSERTLP